MSIVGRVLVLVVLWLLAWGELSVANVVSGVAVASLLLIAFPLRRRMRAPLGLNVRGAVRLAGYVAVQLAVSNVTMAREILRRRPRGQPGVVTYRLRHPSEQVVTLMTSVIALSPGTMTVDVAADSSTVDVHFFRLYDLDVASAGLVRLERLVAGAVNAWRSIDEGEGAT